MTGPHPVPVQSAGAPADEEIIARIRQGETALFELLLRRYNQRIYRAVRSIVRDEAETEDVMQQAYINAFTHLGQFEGKATFSTWLTRIAIHEAFARLKKRERLEQTMDEELYEQFLQDVRSTAPDPEQNAMAAEMKNTLQQLISSLPEAYRTVIVLREVEGLSTTETADCLEVSDDVVKTRLHRARTMLKEQLYQKAGVSLGELFPFFAPRCDRVVAGVFRIINENGLEIEPWSE